MTSARLTPARLTPARLTPVDTLHSWGRYPRVRQTVLQRHWRDEPLPDPPPGISMLARGMGRSYGDSCQNADNAVIPTRPLDRILAFDPASGLLRCEAGVTIDEILAFAVPRGWFPPVTPGTRFVTAGGAIANDVHGKNHHASGCFGNHVDAFELLRSDGSRAVCSSGSNEALYAATIGGLGLTGMIDWAEIRMKPVRNRWMDVETIKMGGLDEFFALSRESEPKFDYLVAWVDTVRAQPLGRGLFIRGNHNQDRPPGIEPPSRPMLPVPFDAPTGLLARWSIGLFNTAFYHQQIRRTTRTTIDYLPFFYPLDAIGDWNRLYGPAGLLQWQCLVPFDGGPEVVRELLTAVARSSEASFLTVLKTMGSLPSRGIIPFGGPGITLALDFARNDRVERLLDRLDAIIAEVGGRLYPAKDARMSAAMFQRSYPRWRELAALADPRFSSSFWRRVTQS